MTLRTALGELLDYNYWARDRQLQACAALSQEQFLSVRDTLAHLVAVEWIWLERWRGRSPQALLAAEELPTLAAISERWSAVERELRAFLGGLSDEALEHPFTYVNSKGETWTYLLWLAVFHVLNHQSYHRGQVTMQLRLLGFEPPQVDFLVAHDMGFRL
ncbi:MAG: DinB family protein [Bryobacteraceae bacterium]|jgi:uncharacterized damage-inducible protein DinB